MIALRPITGQFGPMRLSIKEGRKISEQILKRLNLEQRLKNKEIGYEKGEKKIEFAKKVTDK